jgi:hypothetical protein
MNKSLLTFLCLFSILYSFAQNSNYAKPEYLDIIYIVGENKEQTKLDKVLARAEAQQKGGAFTPQKIIFEFIVPNVTSSVHLSSNKVKFIIEFSMQDPDLQNRIKLYKATPIRKKRIVIAAYSNANSTAIKNTKNELFDLNFKSEGGNIYVFTPDKDLEPGEYIFFYSLMPGGVFGNALNGDIVSYSFTIE